MELTIRDWMIIVGAGMVLVVLIDAVRRIHRERRTDIRLNARVRRSPQVDDEEFNLLSELPNGGARIVRRGDLSVETGGSASAHEPPLDKSEDDTGATPLGPLADREYGEDSLEASNPFEQDYNDAEGDATHNISFSALDDDVDTDATKAGQQEAVVAEAPDTVAAHERGEPSTPETLDWLDQLDVPEADPEPEARLPRGIDPHVFVLNVVARDEQGFSGQDIMQILLACDLRYGDMDFFHRHEQAAGRGPIQFSVANMMKPGVFDIDRMSSLQTRGLMFFVTLPGPEDMLKAFDYMLETAKAVAKNLKGDVLDETRSAITRQSIDHMRQQIRELERRIALER